MLHDSSSSFVQTVEVWTPERASRWTRTTADSLGLRTDDVLIDRRFRDENRLVARALATHRAEVADEDTAAGGSSVGVAIPVFRASQLGALVVLRCESRARAGGCVEIWEPNGGDELVHAEGYYGALAKFELSSRMARFRRGKGLPGLAWEHERPTLIRDVRTSPAFLRADLARENRLATGVGIPIVQRRDVTQVVVMIAAEDRPPALGLEVWTPDRSGRMWIADSVHTDALSGLARTSRTTCYMRGEGLPGRAFDTGRPALWSRHARDAQMTDPDAKLAGISIGLAIPIVRDDEVRAALVLRI